MTAIAFTDLAPDELERVRNFASLPLHASLKCSRKQIESRWVDEIAELLSNESAFGFASEISGAICGLAICAPLPWESPVLGKSMWEIKRFGLASGHSDGGSIAVALVAEVVRRTAARDGDFLLCKAMPSDPCIIHALESNAFLLMDTVLNFVCDCRASASNGDSQQLPEGFTLRLATPSDIEPLVEVARASFTNHFGRFHADPRIGRAAATAIYEEWIRSCANGWADFLVVAMHGDRIAGYSAWKTPSALDQQHGIRLGHYSIGAVHPDFFGRRLFTALTREGVEQLRSSSDWIEAPTHIDNRAAQRGFLRLGWRIVGAQHSFHKWLKPDHPLDAK
jgi:ribosomal protein S18 acetylase RimI-like enzyme